MTSGLYWVIKIFSHKKNPVTPFDRIDSNKGTNSEIRGIQVQRSIEFTDDINGRHPFEGHHPNKLRIVKIQSTDHFFPSLLLSLPRSPHIYLCCTQGQLLGLGPTANPYPLLGIHYTCQRSMSVSNQVERSLSRCLIPKQVSYHATNIYLDIMYDSPTT